MRRFRAARPDAGRLGAAFGLGAVLAVGQAPWGLWWLALPALLALLALASRAPGPLAAGWILWFGAAGHFGLALSWIVEPFLIDIARHGWMAPFALPMLAFGLGLFWAAAGAVGHCAGRGALRPVTLAVALTGAEALRGVVLTGFPWASIGHLWIGVAPVQVAAVLGPNALTLMTALAAALPLAAPRAGTAAAAGLLGLAAAFGMWREAQPLPTAPDLTVRLVQPNADQRLKWLPENVFRFFERQLDLTAAKATDGRRPDLVVWPETAVPWLLNDPGTALEDIARAAGGALVALGIQRTEGTRGWNSLAVLAPDAQVRAIYDKHHLVPFGEYVPFGDLAADWFGIRAFAAQAGNAYSAGPGPRLLDLGLLGRVLPLICYEAVFPGDLRAAPGRADWILQITNDGWFGRLTGPYQHLAQARLRAVEQGLPLLRVANTGVSAAIDPLGRITDSLPLGVAGFADVALPPALPPTPYARFGEIPFLAILAALAVGAVTLRRRVAP